MFDYATQAQRQTGSSFKTFVLMTLIHDEDGDPNDTYYNSHYLAPGWLPGYPTYSVHTAEDSYQGDDQRHPGDGAVGQHRLRAARRRPRHAATSTRSRTRWASPRS